MKVEGESRLKKLGISALVPIVLVGASFLLVLLLRGMVWASDKALPWLVNASAIAIFVCLFVLLPLKKTQRGIGLIMSAEKFNKPPSASEEEILHKLDRGFWNYPRWGDVLRSGWRLLMVAMIAAALASIVGCNKQKARSEMKDGFRAYHSGEYQQANQHFERASVLDPNLLDAQVALAVTATKQYMEFVPTPETTHYAEQAVNQFKQVLDSNPSKEQQILCLKGLATVYVQMEKFDDAYEYNRRLIEVAPDISDSYYAIGVIEWTQTYNFRMSSIGRVDRSDEEFTTDMTACELLRNTNAPKIQIAIPALRRAASLRPEDYSTMAYLNLIYREKAHTDCTDKRERENDLKIANEWMDKMIRLNAVKEIKLRKAAHELTLPTGTID